MYDKILREMRKAVKARRIVFRSHADDELRNEGLTRDDAINCVITGEIVADQYDPPYGQTKYVIYGDTLIGDELGLVARWDDRDNVVVITVFGLKVDDYE